MISCNSLDIHQRGVQLGERLAPTHLAGVRQMFGEPLADLQSRPSVSLVVELDPPQRLWSRIFDAAGVDRATDLPRLAPDKDFSRSRDGLSELLRRAGLDNVSCDAITWIHRTDPEAWWNGPANGIGATGTLMRRQDASTIERIRDQYEQHTTPYRDPDGHLALPTAALLATASVA
jgi:hypothetical protein